MRIRRLLVAILGAGLATAVACGGGGGSSPSEPTVQPAQTVIVEVRDNSYNPKQVRINPGDTVRWVMRGANPGHTVTDMNGGFDSGFVFGADGDVFERTFTAADDNQTFEILCQSHRACCQMQGSVRVGTNAPEPTPGY